MIKYDVGMEFVSHLALDPSLFMLLAKANRDALLLLFHKMWFDDEWEKTINQEVLDIVNRRRTAKKLKVETDNAQLMTFVNKGDYIYNLRICKSIFSNEKVLKALVNSKAIKYGRYIREMARETLKI